MDELADRRSMKQRLETLEAGTKLAVTLLESRIETLETTMQQLASLIAQQTKTMEAMDKVIGLLTEQNSSPTGPPSSTSG